MKKLINYTIEELKAMSTLKTGDRRRWLAETLNEFKACGFEYVEIKTVTMKDPQGNECNATEYRLPEDDGGDLIIILYGDGHNIIDSDWFGNAVSMLADFTLQQTGEYPVDRRDVVRIARILKRGLKETTQIQQIIGN